MNTVSIYKSGRTKAQCIRIAVVEDNKVYVSPRQFCLLQEATLTLAGTEWSERVRQILMLLEDEYTLAKVRGLEVVVDYELEDGR